MMQQTPKLLIYPKGADYKHIQDDRSYYVYYPQQVSLSTSRECTPATLSGNIPDVGGLFPEMGSRVQFLAEDGVCVFVGFLFKADVDRWGNVSFTAYDQLRYLRGDYSNYCTGWEPSEVVKDVLKKYGMYSDTKHGVIESTNVKLMKQIFHAEAGLDVISKMVDFAEVMSARNRVAMNNALSGGGEIWVLFNAPYEGVCFMRAENVYDLIMKRHNQTNTIIGENNLATEFNLSVSIEDLFNSVYVYRQADDYGGIVGVVAEDENSIDKFGPLHYFEQVSDPTTANTEQMKNRATLLLAMKNHVSRGFTVSALGVAGIRAGMFINISFPSYEKILGQVSKTQRAFISDCSHSWEDGLHTMELTLQVATFELPPNEQATGYSYYTK